MMHPGSIISMQPHSARLPNPGDSFVTAKEMFDEIRRDWAKDREAMKKDCKISSNGYHAMTV